MDHEFYNTSQEKIVFSDRYDAAKQLAARLKHYRNDPDAVVLAIPRGGLQTGYVLAKKLGLKLDVILSKKIGHPLNPEFSVGAISLKGEVLDRVALEREGLAPDYIEEQVTHIRRTLEERDQKYHAQSERIPLAGKTVIVTDDGLATGRTVLAAIDLLRWERPKKIVVAVPVAPADVIEEIRRRVDEVVCLTSPYSFYAIGQFYQNFTQVEDDEAIKLLQAANA